MNNMEIMLIIMTQNPINPANDYLHFIKKSTKELKRIQANSELKFRVFAET